MNVSDGSLGAVSPAGPDLPGFEQFAFESGEFSHLVYHAGDPGHPPLLLMPEIAGMSPGLILFARRLVQSRFRIYIPWLFGPFQQRAPLQNAIKLCISREFGNLRTGVSAPVTHWLRALAGHISERNGGSRVGAIGMCLTGAFAIPLVIDPQVVAAVAAQPSVPLSPLFAWLGVGRGSWMHELNIGSDDIAKVRELLASGQANLLAVRCHADRICPREKLQRLRKEFPTGLETREYGEVRSRNRLGDRPHATFTKEYRLEPEGSDDHHSRQAYADLLAFFDRHLRVRSIAVPLFSQPSDAERHAGVPMTSVTVSCSTASDPWDDNRPGGTPMFHAMNIFTDQLLDELAAKAKASPRGRTHFNIHASAADPVQRFFIVMNRNSYVRPHRHLTKVELALVMRGQFDLVTFDDGGSIVARHVVGHDAEGFAFETPQATWHTLLARTDGSAFFEVKEGPYDAASASEFAPWTPAEGDPAVPEFMQWLRTAERGNAFR